MRQPVWQMKILMKPATGIYSVTTWYSDGTQETHEAPLGPIIIPDINWLMSVYL